MPVLVGSIYVRGATTAITRRTNFRKAFLAPWHPLVEQNWLYALADAQAHTGVDIHASHLVINHHHTDVTPHSDNLPEFLRRVHLDVSRALNTLMANESYDQPGQLWDGRPTHRMRLLNAEAQMSSHVYGCLNWQAAGLVEHRDDFPMRGLDHRYWKAAGLDVEIPDVMFDAARRTPRRWLRLGPRPLEYRLFDGDLDALVYHYERAVEHGGKRIAVARQGRPVVGAREIRRIHPWSEPKTLRETGGQRRPRFKAGARGHVGRVIYEAAAKDCQRHDHEHHETRIARMNGDLEQAYPYGTYAAKEWQGAPVQPLPHHDAIVTAPGPTLDEVKAELAARACGDRERACAERDARRAERMAVVDEVKSAFSDEAEEIVERDELELAKKGDSARRASAGSGSSTTPSATNAAADADEPAGDAAAESEDAAPKRVGVEVRHRFDKKKPRADAARVVTHRDRRGRRRPRSRKRRGSDPPD